MDFKTIAGLIIGVTIIVSFAFTVWAVNKADAQKMELAVNNGYVQCVTEDKIVLWKRDCKE